VTSGSTSWPAGVTSGSRRLPGRQAEALPVHSGASFRRQCQQRTPNHPVWRYRRVVFLPIHRGGRRNPRPRPPGTHTRPRLQKRLRRPAHRHRPQGRRHQPRTTRRATGTAPGRCLGPQPSPQHRSDHHRSRHRSRPRRQRHPHSSDSRRRAGDDAPRHRRSLRPGPWRDGRTRHRKSRRREVWPDAGMTKSGLGCLPVSGTACAVSLPASRCRPRPPARSGWPGPRGPLPSAVRETCR
jgi:hypothetical protein